MMDLTFETDDDPGGHGDEDAEDEGFQFHSK
jgi:hypothetical protein